MQVKSLMVASFVPTTYQLKNQIENIAISGFFWTFAQKLKVKKTKTQAQKTQNSRILSYQHELIKTHYPCFSSNSDAFIIFGLLHLSFQSKLHQTHKSGYQLESDSSCQSKFSATAFFTLPKPLVFVSSFTNNWTFAVLLVRPV